jgi:DNA-binding transcriptional ArsR family regulator
MSKFQSVTMQLQKDGIDMHEVRVLFDAIIAEHPNLSRHLSPTADIVHSPHFESGLVKVSRDGDNCSLSRPEKLALEKLKIDRTTNPSPQKDMSFAERALKRVRVQEKIYQNVSFICPTSNVVERLFSTAKLVFSDLRRSLLPRNLEMLLFLKLNRDLWDLRLVGKVVNKK